MSRLIANVRVTTCHDCGLKWVCFGNPPLCIGCLYRPVNPVRDPETGRWQSPAAQRAAIEATRDQFRARIEERV